MKPISEPKYNFNNRVKFKGIKYYICGIRWSSSQNIMTYELTRDGSDWLHWILEDRLTPCTLDNYDRAMKIIK